MSAERQGVNGEWLPAQPLGWQGSGVDWEVYSKRTPLEAVAYDEDVCVAVVRSRWHWLLTVRMAFAARRLRGQS